MRYLTFLCPNKVFEIPFTCYSCNPGQLGRPTGVTISLSLFLQGSLSSWVTQNSVGILVLLKGHWHGKPTRCSSPPSPWEGTPV